MELEGKRFEAREWMQTREFIRVCLLARQRQDVDTPLTPSRHVAAAYFIANGVTVCGGGDEPQTSAEATRITECAGEAQRWGRSSICRLGAEASLYCRTKPNISVLDDRCVLCWEIYFPLYGVFTLAGRFDWYYSGCISMLLQCQYHQGCCSILINCCAGDFQDDLLTRWVEVEAVTFNWIFSY